MRQESFKWVSCYCCDRGVYCFWILREYLLSKLQFGYKIKIVPTSKRKHQNMESSRIVTVRPLRKPKRFRSAFTTEQIAYLERQFKKFPYISSEHRKEISTALDMQERAVKIWFQNRRMKEKKESNTKELDFVNNRMESGKDRLINACTLPSTNEQLSYSLPMIVKPVNTTTFTTPNTDNFLRGTQEFVAQLEPQNLSTNQNNSAINSHIDLHIKHQAPFLNISQKDESSKKLFKKPVFKRSAESIDLSKRLKRSRKEMSIDYKKVQRKMELHSAAVKPRIHDDVSFKKEPLHSRIKPAKVRPAYYPVMPTVYAHPYISQGGVIWKPVNIMPVVAPEAPIRFQNDPTQIYGQNQTHKCSCNCHGNTEPVPNPINPYAQYVITGPTFQNPSPKF